jgi:hypothetical protein
MLVLELLTPMFVLAAFALLAARFGRDSRDGVEDPPQPWLGSTR